MQASRSVGSTFISTPYIEHLDNDQRHTRPIRHGVRLPTIDAPLPYTAKEFEQLDDDISNGEKIYLEYMLHGRYPEGPFFDELQSGPQHQAIASLIDRLIDCGQFTALNELLKECNPLYSLNIQPRKFKPDSFAEFLRTVSESQPSLRQLLFVVPMASSATYDFAEKADTIIGFILRSPHLKKFNIVGIENKFSPKILDAIAEVGHAQSIDFYFRDDLSDATGDSLRQIISRCTDLKSVCLKNPSLSEEKTLEVFQALRNCAQLTELSFSRWAFKSLETCRELQLLIQHSTTLESFKCTDWFSTPDNEPDTPYKERLNAFCLGVAANRSLKSLSLGPLLPYGGHYCIEPLMSALQQQPTIESLEFDGENFSTVGGQKTLEPLADLVEKNQRITEIKGLDNSVDWLVNLYPVTSEIKQSFVNTTTLLQDRLARNSAIARGQMASIYCQAFFSSPGAAIGSNHIRDPGLHLTEHILRLSPNLASFEKAMVEIALTVDETARVEQSERPAITTPSTIITRDASG